MRETSNTNLNARNGEHQANPRPQRVGTDQSRIALSDVRGPNVTPGLQSRSKVLDLDANAILMRAKVHKRFQSGRSVKLICHDLPEFEALYQNDEQEADVLLMVEIQRLVLAARDDEVDVFKTSSLPKSSTPSTTDQLETEKRRVSLSTRSTSGAESQTSASSTAGDVWPLEKPANPSGIQDLLLCLDHLLCNLAVMHYSNCLLLVRNLRWCYTADGVSGIFQSALNEMAVARRRLLAHLVQHCPFVETNLLSPLQPGTCAFSLYDELVDYITAYLMKLLAQSASGSAWLNNTAAIIARLSRKLKDLKTNARSYAEEAVATTDYLHDDLKDENSDASKHFKFRLDEETWDIIDDSIYLKDYFREQFVLRRPFYDILSDILLVLQLSLKDQPSGFLSNDFDFSTLIQKVDFDAALVLSSDDRHNISVTTDEVAMTFSLTACRLLVRMAGKLNRRGLPSTPSHGRAGLLQWWSSNGRELQVGSASIESIQDSLSTVVALAFTRSDNAEDLGYLLESISMLANDITRYAQQPRTTHMAVTLTQSAISHDFTDTSDDVMTLSSYTQHQRHVQSSQDHMYSLGNYLREQYRKYESSINSWTIDAETITVKCPWVVAGIIVPTGLIALAGVALLLAPYHKPKGVDPANFMIFFWSIALSFLLVGKAFFVPDWPWHDFLRSSVACRSITEVSRISGVKEQVIIMHLLTNRPNIALRGPHALVLFTSGLSETESPSTTGFSIDVPVDLPTLYASGFLVLKVNTFKGPLLVCIRGAPRVDADSDTRSALTTRITGELPRHSKQSHSKPELRIRLAKQPIRWFHVHGLYVDRSAKFV
ncbi:MAG: hypothetical protein Q9227_003873 [Pyrenula ochraceoflavens]